MSFDLGLKKINTNVVEDYEDYIDTTDLFYKELQDEAASRLDTLTKSASKIKNKSDQIKILNFLANDSTIRDIIGNDPDTYISRLKKYNDHIQESTEIVGIYTALNKHLWSQRLASMLKRLEGLYDAASLRDYSHAKTKDVRIIPAKEFTNGVNNIVKFLNQLKRGLADPSKFDINSLVPYYEAIGLKIPQPHGKELLLGTLVSAIKMSLAGGILESPTTFSLMLLVMGMGIPLPLALISVIGSYLGYRVGKSSLKQQDTAIHKDYTTATERGWNDNTLKQGLTAFRKLIDIVKEIEVAISQLPKETKKEYPDQCKAIKQGFKAVYAYIYGCTKSTLVLLTAIKSK